MASEKMQLGNFRVHLHVHHSIQIQFQFEPVSVQIGK